MTEDLEQVKKELENQTRHAEERLNQLKYLQADFDNFRKWSEKEKDIDHRTGKRETDQRSPCDPR